jgi:solute carrier family 36 (proton-coupled amino acid transporter)
MSSRPDRYPRYLIVTLLVTMLLLGTFGSLGYLSYGTATQGSITLNFPRDSAVTEAIIGFMILAVLATFPLQMIPVTEIAEQLCWPGAERQRRIVADRAVCDLRAVTALRNALRAALVGACALVAFFVPDFGPFSALVGSFGSGFLAFVIPALADFQLSVHSMNVWRVLKNAAILGFAAVAIITGTYSSLLQIIDDLQQQ